MNQPLSPREARVLAYLYTLSEPFSILDIINAPGMSEMPSKQILVTFNNLHLQNLLDVVEPTDLVLEGHPVFLYSLSVDSRLLAAKLK